MSYKITYLRVFNFKVFDDFELDFKKSSIITLGGPNGYGKTSIFDAIELALTGNIERFIPVDKSTGSTDNIIGKDGKDKVAIKLELSNGSDTIAVRREFNKTNNTKQTNKINNFKNVWITTIFLNNIEEANSSQERFEELLGEQNLSKYYNSFFYIQQEDTAHFLKKDEQARLNLIAQLFDWPYAVKTIKAHNMLL